MQSKLAQSAWQASSHRNWSLKSFKQKRKMHWRWYTWTFAPSPPSHTLDLSISSPLSMITIEKLGCIFQRIFLKHCLHSRIQEHELKRRQRNWSKSLDQIKAMNTLAMNSTTTIDIMGLKGNLVKFTLFNKMVSLRGLKHDSYWTNKEHIIGKKIA